MSVYRNPEDPQIEEEADEEPSGEESPAGEETTTVSEWNEQGLPIPVVPEDESGAEESVEEE